VEDSLSVVLSKHVRKGGRGGLWIGRFNLSLQTIPEHIKETSSQIHVSNRIDGMIEMNASRLLAVSSTPHVFNPF